VGVIFIAAGAMVAGFLLILLMGRNQPVHPAASTGPQGGTEMGWLNVYGIEGFQRLLALLFAEMGWSPEQSSRGESTVDLYAVNPTPLTGGRVYVRGIFAPPLGVVGGEEVRGMIETSRAEFVGKAILVTLGHFSAEARAEAKGAPLDLVDGDALAELVRKHLPNVFAQKKV
jgi:restriction endonuclease Mrr